MPKISISDDLTISVDTVSYLYRNLRALIEQNFLQAKLNKKKLLVMLGENHTGPHSFLMKIIAINIAKDLGIQNLYYEVPKSSHMAAQVTSAFELDIIGNLLRKIKFLKKTFDKIEKWWDGATGRLDAEEYYYRTYRNALKLGFNIIPIDDYDTRQNIDFRNAIMSENLKTYSQDGVLVTGFSHFPGLIEDYGLEQGYHIVPINICYIDMTERNILNNQKKFGYFSFFEKHFMEKDNYTDFTVNKARERSIDYLDPKRAIQIMKHHSNGYIILDHLGEMVNNTQLALKINGLLQQIRRPTLTSLVLEIPTNVKIGFNFISSCCRRSPGISKDRLITVQELDKKSSTEFRSIKEVGGVPIIPMTFSQSSQLTLNLHTLRSIQELGKTKQINLKSKQNEDLANHLKSKSKPIAVNDEQLETSGEMQAILKHKKPVMKMVKEIGVL